MKDKCKTTYYSISIEELIKRPIISNLYADEWMNKMTSVEMEEWDKEVREQIIEDGIVPIRFPDYNAAVLAKTIDRSIIYTLFKEAEDNKNN